MHLSDVTNFTYSKYKKRMKTFRFVIQNELAFFFTQFAPSIDSESSSFSLKLLASDGFSRILYTLAHSSARFSSKIRIF